MKKLVREKREEVERKGFAGRSVLVGELSRHLKEEVASSLILETIRKVTESNSMKEQYGRLIVFHSASIARKRGDPREKPPDMADAIRKALLQSGFTDFDVRPSGHTDGAAVFLISHGEGKYKTIQIPEDLMRLRYPVGEIMKKLSQGKSDTIPDIRARGRSDTMPDLSTLGFSPDVLLERMVVYHGLSQDGPQRRKRFTYHGNGLNAPIEVSAEVAGRELVTAIDLKIMRIHKASKSPFVPSVLEAQSSANSKPLERVPPVAKGIASALNLLVGDAEVVSEMVPSEYFDAFISLRKVFNRIDLDISVKELGAAVRLIDHPAFEAVKGLPPDCFDDSGSINKKGMEQVLRSIAGQKCLLSDKTLRNLAEAYSLVIKDDVPAKWNLPTLRSKHFVMASKIRTFLMEQFQGMTLEPDK